MFWMRWHLLFDEYEKAGYHWTAAGRPKFKR